MKNTTTKNTRHPTKRKWCLNQLCHLAAITTIPVCLAMALMPIQTSALLKVRNDGNYQWRNRGFIPKILLWQCCDNTTSQLLTWINLGQSNSIISFIYIYQFLKSTCTHNPLATIFPYSETYINILWCRMLHHMFLTPLYPKGPSDVAPPNRTHVPCPPSEAQYKDRQGDMATLHGSRDTGCQVQSYLMSSL